MFLYRMQKTYLKIIQKEIKNMSVVGEHRNVRLALSHTV